MWGLSTLLGETLSGVYKLPPVLSEVCVQVPASIANLGVGFDTFSLALTKPFIKVTVTRARPKTRRLIITGPFSKQVTRSRLLHAGAKALAASYRRFKISSGYVLRIEVNIPPRKGLGLSGAEAVGAVLCTNRLFHLNMKKDDVANLAAQAEPSNHMDNVAASTFGGFNIVTPSASAQLRHVTTIPPPVDLGVALIIPDVEKASTEATRKVLPTLVVRDKYVEALGYASRIAWAFAEGDTGALIETLPWDPVIEPARAQAGVYGSGIDAKFLQEEKRALLEKFHVAETISGGGPSRALWFRVDRTGLVQEAVQFVSDRLRSRGYRTRHVIITRPSRNGAAVVAERSVRR